MEEQNIPYPQERVELHAVFYGHVQGVGFRASARFLGGRLGLTGTVRNLPDGSVEVYAQGLKMDLERFIELLKNEGAGRVDSVSAKYFSPHQTYDGFRII